jgi:hypothetical protein
MAETAEGPRSVSLRPCLSHNLHRIGLLHTKYVGYSVAASFPSRLSAILPAPWVLLVSLPIARNTQRRP